MAHTSTHIERRSQAMKAKSSGRAAPARAGSLLLVLCIALLALAVLPAGVLADDKPDLHPANLIINPGGAAAGKIFTYENNTIRIMVQNLGTAASPASILRLESSDGYSGTTAVPAIAAGGVAYVMSFDPLARVSSGGSVTYFVNLDPDNLIAESNEDNNAISYSGPTLWNGYKGQALYRGGSNLTTARTFDLNGGILHSFGSSYYRSGSYGGSWTTFDVTWGYNATPLSCDIAVPAGATVREARLYLPYTWDYPTRDLPDNSVITFNGHDISTSYQTYQWDQGNFGDWGQYRYGLLTYDVTSYYQKNAVNSLHFVRPGANDKLSLYGMTLLVVYEDASASRKQIFLNEGFDLLGADPVNYATNETESTSYSLFAGPTIDLATAKNAILTTFVPSGDSNEGNLYVNKLRIAENVWNYGAFGQPVGEDGSPQVATDVRDIKTYLNPTGGSNTIGIQSTAWNTTPCMVAAQQFLVVEYYEAPVANFAADTVTPSIGQAVTFTDMSTKDPAGWDLDFGDGSAHATGAGPWTHAYTAAGTYTVSLTATNVAGTDTETKTNYIAVGSAPTPLPLPGYTNPPTDPDSDGLYEDMNANNRKDMGDVVLFFENKDWIAANEPLSLFDFNHNSRIDLGDVVVLFEEMV